MPSRRSLLRLERNSASPAEDGCDLRVAAWHGFEMPSARYSSHRLRRLQVQLNLDDSESTLLRNVLSRFLGDLRSEINKTENYEMRVALHHDEEVLKGLLSRL